MQAFARTQPGSQGAPYSSVAVLLHWTLAVALIGQLALGWWMLDLPKSPPGLRAGWFNLHKSIGITIGLFALLRLAWRAGHSPPQDRQLPAWQQRAASTSHALLYVCMIGLPLSGYLGSSFSGYPVRLFGWTLPSWTEAWPAGKLFMSGTHQALVWTFMLLAAMHVAAAFGHWWRADGIAGRMGMPSSRR